MLLDGEDLQSGHAEFAETEADARARMLIYLIDHAALQQLPPPRPEPRVARIPHGTLT